MKPQTRSATFADLQTAGPRARPGGVFSGTHATVESLVLFAYDLKSFQVIGGPDWIRRDLFDVNAKADDSDVPRDRIRLMVQSLLEDRFKFVSHAERREMDYLALVHARADRRLGPYIQQVGDCQKEAAEVRKKFPPRATTGRGGLMSGCSELHSFADLMVRFLLKMPAIDKTGLTGTWVYQAHYASTLDSGAAEPSAAAADPGLPPFAVALEEQLGLKLESARGPIDVLVIDSVQQPTEN